MGVLIKNKLVRSSPQRLKSQKQSTSQVVLIIISNVDPISETEVLKHRRTYLFVKEDSLFLL